MNDEIKGNNTDSNKHFNSDKTHASRAVYVYSKIVSISLKKIRLRMFYEKQF